MLFESIAARRIASLAGAVTLSACGGGDHDNANDSLPVQSSPSASVVNVNIENPVLITADNHDIAPDDLLTLVWSDEFEAARLDPATWFFESGDGSQYGIPGWGNNELQWYLADNAELRDGLLIITAREEARGGKEYTSARISTVDRFAFRYGRIEARIRLPAGQGIWSAFWLLPQDNVYGSWPASGEIDVMEAVNIGASGGNTILGTIHYGGEFPDNTYTANEHVVATNVTAEFHNYALEWDKTQLRWYVDDVFYAAENSWSSSSADFPAPFDQPFYILLNVAVGGYLPGPPDAATSFPAVMEVDYVRVFTGEP